MAKVRDLRDFYKTATKKSNGKSDDKAPPFLSSASGSVNQAGFTATRERHTACRCSSISRSYSVESNACKMDFASIPFFIYSKRDILNGFKAASITEAVESANTVLERIEIWTIVYI